MFWFPLAINRFQCIYIYRYIYRYICIYICIYVYIYVCFCLYIISTHIFGPCAPRVFVGGTASPKPCPVSFCKQVISLFRTNHFVDHFTCFGSKYIIFWTSNIFEWANHISKANYVISSNCLYFQTKIIFSKQTI